MKRLNVPNILPVILLIKDFLNTIAFKNVVFIEIFPTFSNIIEVNGNIYKINDQQRMALHPDNVFVKGQMVSGKKRRRCGNVRLSIRFLNIFFYKFNRKIG